MGHRDIETTQRYADYAPSPHAPALVALGIAEGVQQGAFGYAADLAEEGGSPAVSAPSAVRLRETLPVEAVALDGPSAILRVAVAEHLGRKATDVSEPSSELSPGPGLVVGEHGASGEQKPPEGRGGHAPGLRLAITATEDDLFELNRSLVKLREVVEGGTLRLSVTVEARTADGAPIDRVRARNNVIEPLEEDPDIDVLVDWLGGGEPASD